MCGIAGFTGSEDNTKLHKMMESIHHRGPDGAAVINSPNFQAGMRRLAIIDLSDAETIYPISNPEKTIQILYNGEIYNYQSLREELKNLGYKFRTQSDSEVIVYGYQQWGEQVLERLRGMFAIVLYDKVKDQLFLARDRLGIKPLYYAQVNGQIVFASEIKAILEYGNVDRRPNDISVYRFLVSRVHDDTEATFFQNIKRLMPAHYMVINNHAQVSIHQYWQPEINTEFSSKLSDQEYAEQFREQFLESMRLHLISDVPLGVTLSGGLDSSAVTSVANKFLQEGTSLHTEGNKLLAFSALHPGETIDESTYIKEVLNYTGAESHTVVPNVDQFWSELETWVYFQEEPTISTAPYAYYCVMREAHKYVKVLLSGQGGDELLAGYIPYFMSYLQSAKDAGKYWEMLRESIDGFDLYKDFIWQKLDTKLNANKQLDIWSLINQDHLHNLDHSARVNHTHDHNLSKRLWFDVSEGSVPNLLRYEDKNSMAHSIESRVPFLDHKMVEFVFSLPIDQKIKFGWNRYVYRNAMKGLMPEKNRLRRSKIGFVNSEWEWLQAKQVQILEIFNSDKFKNRPYWNAAAVTENFQKWVAGELRGDGLMFWRILSTELWLRRFVD